MILSRIFKERGIFFFDDKTKKISQTKFIMIDDY